MQKGKIKIGIIGFGNMGSAIAEQLKTKYPVSVFDQDKSKTQNLFGINAAQDMAGLLSNSDTVILAVKPQDFSALFTGIEKYLQNKLIISIAAGITTVYIEKILGHSRVIRAMPNLPARIGQGVTCLSKGRFATDDDLDFAKKLFDYLGKALIIKEEMMNAATAISGSGPAYVCDYLESGAGEKDFLNKFLEAAAGLGFSQQEAGFLVRATLEGSKEFLKQAALSPQDLKKQVASKGGATEAALKVLHNGGSLEEAVKAALKRAEELSKKE